MPTPAASLPSRVTTPEIDPVGGCESLDCASHSGADRMNEKTSIATAMALNRLLILLVRRSPRIGTVRGSARECRPWQMVPLTGRSLAPIQTTRALPRTGLMREVSVDAVVTASTRS